MRRLPGAVGVLLLLVLLTWLLLRGTDTNAPAHAVTLQALDDFALAEASLDRDLLQARAGLLRDYDPLATAVRAMEDAVARLRSRAQAEGLEAGPADRLAATVAQREELTERFKSSKADCYATSDAAKKFDGPGQEGAIASRPAHDHWMNSPSSGRIQPTIHL